MLVKQGSLPPLGNLVLPTFRTLQKVFPLFVSNRGKKLLKSGVGEGGWGSGKSVKLQMLGLSYSLIIKYSKGVLFLTKTAK